MDSVDFSYEYTFSYNAENNPIFNSAKAFFAISSISFLPNSPSSYNVKGVITEVTSNSVKLRISKKSNCSITRLVGKIIIVGLQNGMFLILK
jgi:hypothetical protein